MMTATRRGLLLCIPLLFSPALYAQAKTPPPKPNSVKAPPPPPKPSPKAPIEFHNIVYSSPSGGKLMLDVFQHPDATEARPAPVLIYYHGGGWARDERPKQYYIFSPYIEMGFTVITVDYRLTATATAPAAVTDVLCSLAWTRENAKQYHFDLKHIVTYGTSAGGHLALLAGMLPTNTDIADPACGKLPKVAAILDFYGLTDLPPGLVAPWNHRPIINWIGNPKDPAALAKKLSPITYVRAGQPPVFIVHGDADQTVPYAQSLELQKALLAAKVPSLLYTVRGGKHGQFTPEERKGILELVHTFLLQHKVLSPSTSSIVPHTNVPSLPGIQYR